MKFKSKIAKIIIVTTACLALMIGNIIPITNTNIANAESKHVSIHSAPTPDLTNVNIKTPVPKFSMKSLQSLNQYVTVENNRYVLSIPDNVKINPDLKKAAQYSINAANLQVISNNLVINPATEQFDSNDTSGKYLMLAKSLPAHEVRHYWWGTRNIFRTSTAIENFSYQLNRASITTGVILLFGVPGAILGTFSIMYMQLIALDLNHMHAIHPRSKLALDSNYDLAYKVFVWYN
jgi:hypothetical protein